ncbi:hypothetical protein I6G56_10725 [Burkholderia humptydooensis]|uniref:Uncharacterized protein n=1 Tax=Burkholderia humptydooensis TaxID=430531 RepID=A0A7T2WXT7_9BURK|nr:hypothetical protein BW21_2060 [Burkholderia sp. 2002721687]QPS42125.1 hypothetical protein I6G56_10725 [Burkholderia humptydooensis]
MKKLLWLWKTEIERIGKLQWWEQVVEKKVDGFPKEPNPWHFHPIEIVGNFKVSASTALDELIRKIGDIIASGEGEYDAYNTETKGVSGGHVGHSHIRGGAPMCFVKRQGLTWVGKWCRRAAWQTGRRSVAVRAR